MGSAAGSATASGSGAASATASGWASASELVSGAAGSSATAIAATVSSDAGVSLEAIASGAGAVPPCKLVGQGDQVSYRGFRP